MGFGDAVASSGPYANICTSLQTDDHNNTPSRNCFTDWMLFLTPNQQQWGTQENGQNVIINVSNHGLGSGNYKNGRILSDLENIWRDYTVNQFWQHKWLAFGCAYHSNLQVNRQILCINVVVL